MFLLLLTLLITASFTDAGSLKLPVYTQSYTTDEFLYQENLPEMSQNTFCFWINLGADDGGFMNDFLFSVSISNRQNAYTVGFRRSFFVYLNNNEYTIVADVNDVVDLFIGWHRHCFTWIGSSFKWYTEVNTLGILELFTTVFIPSYTLPSGGALILMQEQDSHFGSLDVTEVALGKIAWVNMWNYALTENQIKMLRCRDEGNIVNWNTLSQQGASLIHYESFQCQDGELNILEKRFFGSFKQDLMLCKISGASLLGVMNVNAETVDTPTRCVLLCTKSDSCLSANYQYSTGVCTLNDDIDQGNEGDFENNLGSDFMHFTARECTDA